MEISSPDRRAQLEIAAEMEIYEVLVSSMRLDDEASWRTRYSERNGGNTPTGAELDDYRKLWLANRHL